MLYYINMGDNRIRGETDAGSMFGFHFYVGKDARLALTFRGLPFLCGSLWFMLTDRIYVVTRSQDG